jgi:hypothetical protein
VKTFEDVAPDGALMQFVKCRRYEIIIEKKIKRF